MYPIGIPALMIPSPGTDLRNTFDLMAVNPPGTPNAPHRQFANDRKVPYP